MAGTAAQTYTLQLNSATAQKTSDLNEEYRLQLTPPIACPFMARPRCMLEQLAFSNCFSNIDKARYGNQSLAPGTEGAMFTQWAMKQRQREKAHRGASAEQQILANTGVLPPPPGYHYMSTGELMRDPE